MPLSCETAKPIQVLKGLLKSVDDSFIADLSFEDLSQLHYLVETVEKSTENALRLRYRNMEKKASSQ
ncbi:MAG: hypothetical protein HFJ28_01310 [Clostridia bacterium]|nr:hypothetical protein [Clostridia bacterium]